MIDCGKKLYYLLAHNDEVMMKALLAVLVLSMAASFAQAEVLGFREWKKSQIQKTLNKRLPAEQAKNNVEIARKLTVQDYFVLYLDRQEDRQKAFKEVSTKLSSKEMAELLLAYSNSLR